MLELPGGGVKPPLLVTNHLMALDSQGVAPIFRGWSSHNDFATKLASLTSADE